MIVAGIGYRSDTTPADLDAALALTGATPDALASLDGKAAGPLAALAQTLNLPLIALSEDQIAGVQTLTCSPRIKARFATGSLAEACALVAAGPAARLTHPRVIGPCGRVTVAIAEGSTP